MQSLSNLSRALYRIVFRRGSPQRVHYSQPRFLAALGLSIGGAVGTQLAYFGADVLDTGVLLFVLFSGFAVGVALLTWKVPRSRLLPTLLAVLLVTAIGFCLLWALGLLPVNISETARLIAAGLVGLAALVGLANCLQFALQSSTTLAFGYAGCFALALILLYTTLSNLLAVVFSA